MAAERVPHCRQDLVGKIGLTTRREAYSAALRSGTGTDSSIAV
jgi:Arc/MetJ family transcription regulator